MTWPDFLDRLVRFRVDALFFVSASLGAAWIIHVWIKKKHKTGISTLVWTLIVLFTIFGVIFAEIAAGLEKSNLKRLIGGLAPTYASELEKAGHAKLNLQTSPEDPLYLALIEDEIRWEKLNLSIQDIYTFRQLPDGRLSFIVDSETDYDHSGKYEGDRESRTVIGEIYNQNNSSITRALAGEANFDAKPYTDRWGTWVSAYAPMLDAQGNVEAVLGVDYDAAQWVVRVLLYRLGALSLVIIPIIILTAVSALTALLQANEEQYRSLVSNIPGAIYRIIQKPFPQFDFFSDEIQEITGYPPLDFLGNPKRTYESIMDPQDVPEVLKTIEMALEKKQPYSAEYRIHTAKNEIRWVYEQGQGVFDDKNNLLWRDGAILDISRRKQLEEKIFKSKRMESITQLAGGLAHDFNNLLTVINGYAEMRVQTLPESDILRQDFEEILKAGKRASLLTDRLVTYSGRQMVQPSIINLEQFITDLGNVLDDFCGEKIVLKIRLNKQPGLIRINAGLLEQILVNVLTNCRDAMPQGGEVIIETNIQIIRPEDAELHLDLKPGEYVVLTIKDNGPGISEEVKAHAFEPFYTRKYRNKDSGMGLATVYGIVKQAEGNTFIKSNPSKGTTVEVYLPRIVDKAIKSSEAPALLSVPSGAETILVVDDEAMVLELACKILKHQGYHVLSAADADEALQVAASNNGIQLLFTDVIMPKMGGKKLAEVLKNARPELKVLFASGYSDGQLMEAGAINSQVNFIRKPYAADALSVKIRQVLDE